MKHKMEKLKSLMEKACQNEPCASFFETNRSLNQQVSSSPFELIQRSFSYIKKRIETVFRRMPDGTYKAHQIYY